MMLQSNGPGGDGGGLGRRKASIREENCRTILAAAEEVFAQEGFGGATMADIARTAGLPKANLHYYFGTKEDLYREVLRSILSDWMQSMGRISASDDPAASISAYVRSKMAFSRHRPAASRVFAAEIIRGAPMLGTYLDEVGQIISLKSGVIDDWARRGLVPEMDGRHAFIMLWAITQHYADFEVQVRAILGKARLTGNDWDEITLQVEKFVLRAMGLRS